MRAFSGVNAQAVTYTTGSANVTGTVFGLNGVRGTADAGNSSPTGNVGVQVAGAFDRLEIVFTQQFAPGGDGSHGIGISNIQVTPVPEPSSLVVAILGMAALLRRSRRRCA